MKLFQRVMKFSSTNISIVNDQITIDGKKVDKNDSRYQKILKEFKADMDDLSKDMKELAEDLKDIL